VLGYLSTVLRNDSWMALANRYASGGGVVWRTAK
jgi:hypothetical protein